MNENIVKNSVVCNTEKSFDNFYKKYGECKACNIKIFLKCYHSNKEELIQQRRDKCARFKDSESRLKALEEQFTRNGSENN